MLGGKALRYRFVLGLIVGAVVASALGLTAKAYFARKQSANSSSSSNPDSSLFLDEGSHNSSPFLFEGFDFNLLRSSDNEWRGPKIGEKVDLSRLKTKDGKTLASMAGKRPIVLASINPECAMCKVATDEMIHLRNKLSSMDINYYLVFFAAEAPQSDFFKYCDSLNVGGTSFMWNAEGGAPPESIFMMTTPSHLLLAGDGTVIQVWPGSYRDKAVRQRMARQILADTLVATDTLNAVLQITNPKR